MNSEIKEHRILIICHTFPPNFGIGGRRWAKFAKYLHRKGVSLEVLSSNLGTKQVSPWKDDVAGIPQSFYRNTYPSSLSAVPTGFFQKVLYRWNKLRLELLTKGTPYDRAILDLKDFKIRLLDCIDRFRPDTLIVSGAPFSLLYKSLEIRKLFPEITWVGDFRDPWSWGEAFGYRYLSTSRLKYETECEESVVNGFDIITTPSGEIARKLKEMYPSRAQHIKYLPHGFDPDDVEMDGSEGGERFLIYGGTLYKSCLEQFNKLEQYFTSNHRRFEVYTDSDHNLISGENVHNFPTISSKEFFSRVRRSQWVLLLIPDHVKNTFPTKFYELVATGTPILAMGSAGELSRYIEDKGLGRYASDNSSLDEILNGTFEVTNTRDTIRDYEMSKLTDELLNLVYQN
jgi:glycosyltransferase involved in cell wall biosynthesis